MKKTYNNNNKIFLSDTKLRQNSSDVLTRFSCSSRVCGDRDVYVLEGAIVVGSGLTV